MVIFAVVGPCISIHAPRVGSDCRKCNPCRGRPISIHAPRVGSDPLWWASFSRPSYFNPRSPCGERRSGTARQSSSRRYFNPRSPCGERRRVEACFPAGIHFNPRSPCGERRTATPCITSGRGFQSTLPVWGATEICRYSGLDETISIHAPRVGSDGMSKSHHPPFSNFNPRSPCGERPERFGLWLVRPEFQSTLPVWGATFFLLLVDFISDISIHAPRVGSDG